MSTKPFLASYEPIEGEDVPSQAKDALTGMHEAETHDLPSSNSERLVAQLSEQFQVVSEGGDAPIQWMLQKRFKAKNGDGWMPLSFCMSRKGLLLAIREKCIPAAKFHQRHEYPGLDPAAIAVIKALPEHFQHMKKRERGS